MRSITKKDAKVLYGIAILMMIFHHMFSDPSWMIGRAYSSFFGIDANIHFAWFCKLCVSIYSFLAGYALCVVPYREFKGKCFECGKRILNLYKKGWFVFLLFVPPGFIAGVFKFAGVKQLLQNLVFLKCDYCFPWWYISQYVIFMLISPVICLFFNRVRPNRTAMTVLYIAGAVAICILSPEIGLLGKNRIVQIYVFMGGYIACYANWKDPAEYIRNNTLRTITDAIILAACISFRIALAGSSKYCAADPVIISPFLMSIRHLSVPVRQFLSSLGEMSTYMWLTHAFITYYYLQKVVTAVPVCIVMYAIAVLITFFAAKAISFLEGHLYAKYNYTRNTGRI